MSGSERAQPQPQPARVAHGRDAVAPRPSSGGRTEARSVPADETIARWFHDGHGSGDSSAIAISGYGDIVAAARSLPTIQRKPAAHAAAAQRAAPAQHMDPADLSGVPFWIEAYLVGVLEQPVPEGDQKKADARFELVLAGARGLTEDGRRALLVRIQQRRHDDKLANLIHGKLHHASAARLDKELREPVAAKAPEPVQKPPAAPDARSPIDFGEASREVKKLGRVQAPKGVYLKSKPIPSAPHVAEVIVPFDAQVFVTRETLQPSAHDRWCYVVATEHNVSGFVPEMFIAVDPPDVQAHLHRVTKGETLGQIATAAYGKNFKGGNDQRLYVQGLYEANKDRAGMHLDKVDLSWTAKWHREEAEERTLEIYQGVKILEGTSLWVPSEAFIQRLKAMGAITSGSSEFSKLYRAARDLVDDAIEAVKYIAGFIVGLLEGAFDAIKDLFVGAVEMIKAVVEVVWNLITGDIGAVKGMLTGWVKKMKAVWEHRGEIADEFMKKWNAPDGWDRGRFQGEVLGWVMMTVFLIIVTMGEDAPAAVAGIGNKWPALVRLLRVVDAAGDVMTYLGAAAKAAKLPATAARFVGGKFGKVERAAEHVAEDVGKDAGRLGHKADAVAEHGPGKASEHAAPAEHGPERGPERGTPASELLQVFRKAKKFKKVQAVSLKRLRIVLGQAGATPGKYKLVRATEQELAAIGGEASGVFGWVTRDGANKVARDVRGRPIITFTPRGLASLEEAVKTFGHEVQHLKDFAAGVITSSEDFAEEAGEKLWLVVQAMRKGE